MFGYVVINQAEMKFREYDMYHAYYCGLCQALKERYGARGQITLTYDMTFVVMLLSALYEPETKRYDTKCIVHPLKRHPVLVNQFSEYGADMNVLLSYEKCRDDWKDEKKLKKKVLAGLLKKADRRVADKYPEKVDRILTYLKKIYDMEEENALDIDQIAGYYGEVMAEIFAYEQDIWEETLRRMGFFLGKFIYIMDAFEDVESDLKSGNYNPLKGRYQEDPEGFNEKCREILTMMMAECSRAFEKLPVIENAEILRNILYSGVWFRYQQVVNRRNNQESKK